MPLLGITLHWLRDPNAEYNKEHNTPADFVHFVVFLRGFYGRLKWSAQWGPLRPPEKKETQDSSPPLGSGIEAKPAAKAAAAKPGAKPAAKPPPAKPKGDKPKK